MIIATNNKGKLREIKAILNYDELKSLSDIRLNIDIEENQDTFYGNAFKKAYEIFKLTNEEVISDDSGLCIDILNGWPGVYTHRFLGEDKSEEERNLAILEKLRDLPLEKRKASVVSNIVYYNGIDTIVGGGTLKGYISFEPIGDNGFGFDKIFMLEDGRTLAQLSLDEKNKVSARYLALIDLKDKMDKRL